MTIQFLVMCIVLFFVGSGLTLAVLMGIDNGRHWGAAAAAHGDPAQAADNGARTVRKAAAGACDAISVRASKSGVMNVSMLPSSDFQRAIPAAQAALIAMQNVPLNTLIPFYPPPPLPQIPVSFSGLIAPTLPPRPKLPSVVTTGEIEAWRAWSIDGTTLCSVHMGTHWEPGAAMTGDPDGDHGVHAWKTLHDALAYALSYTLRGIPVFGYPLMLAIGRVHLWGNVVEHKRGYRAENAAIVAIEAIIPSRQGDSSLEYIRALYCPPPPAT